MSCGAISAMPDSRAKGGRGERREGTAQCLWCERSFIDGETGHCVVLSREAKEVWWSHFHSDPECEFSKQGICSRCESLPERRKKKLARKALRRELRRAKAEIEETVRREVFRH